MSEPHSQQKHNAPHIAPARIQEMIARESEMFLAKHPKSIALAEQTQQNFLFGVPLHWMADWRTPVPLFVERAQGAEFTCVDGHGFIDFCLGDTGAMFGHSPKAVADALKIQAERGYTTMLPTADAAAAGRALSERFGLPYWQLATTATDANRFALRWARALTGRKNYWCSMVATTARSTMCLSIWTYKIPARPPPCAPVCSAKCMT